MGNQEFINKCIALVVDYTNNHTDKSDNVLVLPEIMGEVESLGLQISALLIEKGNPHQRVEITQEGVKIVSDDSFAPIERR